MEIKVWCTKGFTFESKEAAKAFSNEEVIFERTAIRLNGSLYLLTGPVNVYNEKLEVVSR